MKKVAKFEILVWLVITIVVAFSAGWGLNELSQLRGQGIMRVQHSPHHSPITVPVLGDNAPVETPVKSEALQSEEDFLERLRVAAAEDLEQLFQEVDAQPTMNEMQLMGRLLVSRWLDIDPDQAVTFFSQGSRRQMHLHYMFQEWGRRDPEVAVAKALAIADVKLSKTSYSNALAGVAESYPERFMALKAMAPEDLEMAGDCQTAFLNLARRDLTSARGQIELLSGRERVLAVGGLARAWAETDPAAALSWAEELANQRQKEQALGAILKQWHPDDLDKTGKLLDQIGENSSYGDVGLPIASELADHDLDKALEWALKYLPRDPMRRFASSQISKHLEAGDVQTAIKVIDTLPDGYRNDVALNMVHRTSSNSPLDRIESNMRDLLSWVNAMEPTELRGMITNSIFNRARENPQLAKDLIASVNDPALREAQQQKIEAALDHNIPQNIPSLDAFNEVLEQLKQHPPEQLESNVAKALGRAAPEIASAHLDLLPPGEQRAETAKSIAREWATYAPDKAANWATSLNDAEQKKAYGAIARQWIDYDSYAASEWAGTLQPGAPRDAAVEQLVKFTSGSEPEAAFAWAATISDQAAREKSLQNAITALATSLPREAVVDHIRSTSLPADEQEQIIQALSAPR